MEGFKQYYAVFNGASWFVKEAEFFKSQGGLEQSWGARWRLLPDRYASIEAARKAADALWGDDERQMRDELKC